MRHALALLWCSMIVLAGCEPAATPDGSAASAPILLFEGEGASAGDVRAWKTILNSRGLQYSSGDSELFNRMSVADFRELRLLIVPGGNFEQMGRALAPRTSAAIREAVNGGTHYLGVCAGAFLAGASPYNGLDLFSGTRFGFHSLSHQQVRKASVSVDIAGAGSAEHYWEDGPELSGWGGVIAKYSDGTPAVVQGAVGSGWVILSGTHPEADATWWDGSAFRASVPANLAFAADLLEAALDGRALAQFAENYAKP